MRYRPVICSALLVAAFAATAMEEVVVTSDALPAKGMSQSGVLGSYGPPVARQPRVGGGSVHQPPITRWDYQDFVVVFENDHVVDVVQKNNPAPIRVRSGLDGGPDSQ